MVTRMEKTGLMMVIVVTMAVLLSPQPASAASVFTAFSRGFEHQEEIQSTVITRGRGWESRQVPARVWVCTRQPRTPGTSQTSTTSQLAAFMRLFTYLNGRNDRDQRLPMGIPVSIEARTVEGGGKELSACFFLPESVQSNPPTPSDPLVYLSSRPSQTILTRRFGGFATDEDDWVSEASVLSQLLSAEGQQTQANLQYWNAYDPPYKFWNRRNEVWFVQA